MYHMLTGSPPFNAESAMAVMRMHLDAAPTPLKAMSHGIDSGLASIVERCMAKEPADRFMTASELLKELTAVRPADSSESGGARDTGGPGEFGDSGDIGSVIPDGPAVQRFEIGDDEEPEDHLSAREIASAMLRPDADLSTDKVCKNCGLGGESDRRYCLRCGMSEWREFGQSVYLPPFTVTGASLPARGDPVPEQGLLGRAVMLFLLAIVLSVALAALLVWSKQGDDGTASAGFSSLAEAAANLDVPIVKRLTTVSAGGETRVELGPVEAEVIGVSIIAFRARFGGIDTAIAIDPNLEASVGPPPEPIFRQFSIRVFAQPDIGAERFIFRFAIPETWLAEHSIELAKVRLWTHADGWAPLETFHISSEDGVATFLGFAPRIGVFALGALP